MSRKEIAKFFGIKLEIYERIIARVQEKEPDLIGFGWRPNKLLAIEKLWVTLLKFKTNLPLESLAMLFDIGKTTCHRYIKRIEKVLADYQEEKMLDYRYKVKNREMDLIVDVTEIKKKDLKNLITLEMIFIREKRSNTQLKAK